MGMEITFDQPLIDEIAARFDLREPNKRALEKVIGAIVDADGEFRELVADLATGVGKTFLMSSLIDYLATQGVRHVLVVTPGSVIQRKTLANFNAASGKYVAGAEHEPTVITPENFQTGAVATALDKSDVLKVFVFNVQQLIRPTDKVSRKTREHDENIGNALYSYLVNADDLFVIADEHHIYHEKAKSFSKALKDLHPVALIGLTATPDPGDQAKVVFHYTLGEAIADGHVKVPVIVYRKDGTKDETTQLADACHLLRKKEAAYAEFVNTLPKDAPAVKPCLFVVCSSIQHVTEVGQLLAQDGFIGDGDAVLEITSDSSEDALAELAAVDEPGSKIRAIVSVNMLREGWDVRRIAVITALRRLASQTLTEQILGRGLRLPFGAITGVANVDQVDIVAHDSYKQLLAQKDVLRQRIQSPPESVDVDESGAATTAGPLTPPDPDVPTENAKATDDAAPDSEATESEAEAGEQVSPVVFTPGETVDDTNEGALFFVETDDRTNTPDPKAMDRVDKAPQIKFPRRVAELTYAEFSLSEIADGDAEAAGARFITEVPTFLGRDALTASREGEEVTIKVAPQANVEAQQALAGIDTIREELVEAIFRQVASTRAEKNGAKRLIKAFLKGAGVTSTTPTAEWGENRRHQAVEGMSTLIRDAYNTRPRQMTYKFDPVTLPIEPVLVEHDAKNAYNDKFAKHVQFTGWLHNIMPVATFDAGTTEWELAKLLDNDDDIEWWLRVYTNGPAFIPVPQGGNYFPDFIALDKDGSYWLIEGKANKDAVTTDVLAKKEAAIKWARAVRDDGNHGDWHYIFATETHIKNVGSFANLKMRTSPE